MDKWFSRKKKRGKWRGNVKALALVPFLYTSKEKLKLSWTS